MDVKCEKLKVGMIVKVNQNERIPADLLLLFTTEKTGSVFIRTDQLDGETDWKHRKALKFTQAIKENKKLIDSDCKIFVSPPSKRIEDFKGYYIANSDNLKEPLSIDNSLWANTVLAT